MTMQLFSFGHPCEYQLRRACIGGASCPLNGYPDAWCCSFIKGKIGFKRDKPCEGPRCRWGFTHPSQSQFEAVANVLNEARVIAAQIDEADDDKEILSFNIDSPHISDTVQCAIYMLRLPSESPPKGRRVGQLLAYAAVKAGDPRLFMQLLKTMKKPVDSYILGAYAYLTNGNPPQPSTTAAKAGSGGAPAAGGGAAGGPGTNSTSAKGGKSAGGGGGSGKNGAATTATGAAVRREDVVEELRNDTVDLMNAALSQGGHLVDRDDQHLLQATFIHALRQYKKSNKKRHDMLEAAVAKFGNRQMPKETTATVEAATSTTPAAADAAANTSSNNTSSASADTAAAAGSPNPSSNHKNGPAAQTPPSHVSSEPGGEANKMAEGRSPGGAAAGRSPNPSRKSNVEAVTAGISTRQSSAPPQSTAAAAATSTSPNKPAAQQTQAHSMTTPKHSNPKQQQSNIASNANSSTTNTNSTNSVPNGPTPLAWDKSGLQQQQQQQQQMMMMPSAASPVTAAGPTTAGRSPAPPAAPAANQNQNATEMSQQGVNPVFYAGAAQQQQPPPSSRNGGAPPTAAAAAAPASVAPAAPVVLQGISKAAALATPRVPQYEPIRYHQPIQPSPLLFGGLFSLTAEPTGAPLGPASTALAAAPLGGGAGGAAAISTVSAATSGGSLMQPQQQQQQQQASVWGAGVALSMSPPPVAPSVAHPHAAAPVLRNHPTFAAAAAEEEEEENSLISQTTGTDEPQQVEQKGDHQTRTTKLVTQPTKQIITLVTPHHQREYKNKIIIKKHMKMKNKQTNKQQHHHQKDNEKIEKNSAELNLDLIFFLSFFFLLSFQNNHSSNTHTHNNNNKPICYYRAAPLRMDPFFFFYILVSVGDQSNYMCMAVPTHLYRSSTTSSSGWGWGVGQGRQDGPRRVLRFAVCLSLLLLLQLAVPDAAGAPPRSSAAVLRAAAAAPSPVTAEELSELCKISVCLLVSTRITTPASLLEAIGMGVVEGGRASFPRSSSSSSSSSSFSEMPGTTSLTAMVQERRADEMAHGMVEDFLCTLGHTGCNAGKAVYNDPSARMWAAMNFPQEDRSVSSHLQKMDVKAPVALVEDAKTGRRTALVSADQLRRQHLVAERAKAHAQDIRTAKGEALRRQNLQRLEADWIAGKELTRRQAQVLRKVLLRNMAVEMGIAALIATGATLILNFQTLTNADGYKKFGCRGLLAEGGAVLILDVLWDGYRYIKGEIEAARFFLNIGKNTSCLAGAAAGATAGLAVGSKIHPYAGAGLSVIGGVGGGLVGAIGFECSLLGGPTSAEIEKERLQYLESELNKVLAPLDGSVTVNLQGRRMEEVMAMLQRDEVPIQVSAEMTDAVRRTTLEDLSLLVGEGGAPRPSRRGGTGITAEPPAGVAADSRDGM
eukprot:gene2191-1358_t